MSDEMSVMDHLRKTSPLIQKIDEKLGEDADKDTSILGRVKEIDKDVEEVRQDIVGLATQAQLQALDDKFTQFMSTQLDMMRAIQATLGVPSNKLQIQFEGETPGMPGQETDTQTIPATAIETDAAGNPVTLNPASVSWALDDQSIASMTQNPDGSATFKALKPGTANITVTDSSQTPPAVGTDTLTVTSSGPNKLSIQFGSAA